MCIQRGLDFVQTPFVVVVQHDRPFLRSFDLPKVLTAMLNRVSLYLVPTVAQIRYFTKILAGGRCPPDPPIFGWGGKVPPDPPLKRSFVTFDRGGQTGPPRSNDFFFGAADDTGAARTSGQTPGRTSGETPGLTL